MLSRVFHRTCRPARPFALPLFFIPAILASAALVAAADMPSGLPATRPAVVNATAGKPQAHLVLGDPAPEIAATTLTGKPISLAGLRDENPGKIIVLQFGSVTDPIFRAHTPAVENLAQKYDVHAAFVLLYQREAHPADGPDPLEVNNTDGFNIAQPASLAERQKLALDSTTRLKITRQTVIVDAWNNTSSLRYGSYPNMTFIIDVAGRLQAGYPWMDTAKVRPALDALIAGNPLPPELKGSVQHSGPAPFDASDAAMEMTGGRGPANIAKVLDHISLTDPQKQALYPALADFLATLQEFRQTANALPGGARGGRAGAAPPPPPQPNGGTTPKVSTLQDVQNAQSTLRAAATRLQTLIKQTLPEKEATPLLQALTNMVPQQRLFQ